MKVAVRADAGVLMGTGHVMRCVTLCDSLRARGSEIHFICREQQGDLCSWLIERGFYVHTLPESSSPIAEADPDATNHGDWLYGTQLQDAAQTVNVLNLIGKPNWLLADHYSLSKVWHQGLRPYTEFLMVIDDLADRSYEADLLLDQNLGRTRDDYQGLTSAQVLAGLNYALLRPEFSVLRERVEVRDTLKNIVVTLGGADANNATAGILDALKAFDGRLETITVILGASNPHFKAVDAKRSLFHETKVCVVQGISNVGEEFAKADLAIGAAGGTSWERCALGLPTVVVQLAANQKLAADALHGTGAAIGIDIQDIAESLPFILQQLLTSPDKLRRMSKSAFALVDGKGVERVIDRMMSLSTN